MNPFTAPALHLLAIVSGFLGEPRHWYASRRLFPHRSVGPSSSSDPWTMPSSRCTTKELPFWWSFTMRLAHWDESKVEWSTSESSAKSTNPNQLLWRCVAKCKRLSRPGEHWWTVAAILRLEASRTFLKHVMRNGQEICWSSTTSIMAFCIALHWRQYWRP